MKRLLTALAVLAAMSAWADIINLTSDDFETNAVDALLPKGAAGTHGIYAYTTDRYVRADPSNAANQVVVVNALTNTSGGGYTLDAYPIAGAAKSFDYLASNNLKLVCTYDVLIPTSTYNQCFATLYWKDTANVLAGFNFRNQNSRTTPPIQYAFTTSAWVNSGINSTNAQWWTVTYDIHQLEDESWAFTGSMSNKSVPGVTMTVVEDLVVGGLITSSNSFTLLKVSQYSTAGIDNKTYIDNISVSYVSTVIPEPGTMLALALGGLLLFGRRFRI